MTKKNGMCEKYPNIRHEWYQDCDEAKRISDLIAKISTLKENMRKNKK